MRRNIAQANPDATVFYGPSPGKKNRSLRGGLLPPEKNLAKSLKFPPGEIGDLDPPPFWRSPGGPRGDPSADAGLFHGGGEPEQPHRVRPRHAVLPHAPRDVLVGERELG